MMRMCHISPNVKHEIRNTHRMCKRKLGIVFFCIRIPPFFITSLLPIVMEWTTFAALVKVPDWPWLSRASIKIICARGSWEFRVLPPPGIFSRSPLSLMLQPKCIQVTGALTVVRALLPERSSAALFLAIPHIHAKILANSNNLDFGPSNR